MPELSEILKKRTSSRNVQALGRARDFDVRLLNIIIWNHTVGLCSKRHRLDKSILKWNEWENALREKYPDREYFLVCIFPHSDWIRIDTKYLTVFSPNAGKYGAENTPYLDTFHAVTIRYSSQK